MPTGRARQAAQEARKQQYQNPDNHTREDRGGAGVPDCKGAHSRKQQREGDGQQRRRNTTEECNRGYSKHTGTRSSGLEPSRVQRWRAREQRVHSQCLLSRRRWGSSRRGQLSQS